MNNFKCPSCDYEKSNYYNYYDNYDNYKEKYEMVCLFSNPEKALLKAQVYFGDDVKLYISNRKDKKYMLLNPQTNKYIHFGELTYEDWTYRRCFKKLCAFRNRNQRLKDRERYSSAFMSYHILW